MNKLGAVLMAGLMAFVLSACGEDKPKQPEVQTDEVMTQPAPMNEDATKPANTMNDQNKDQMNAGDMGQQDTMHQEAQSDNQTQE